MTNNQDESVAPGFVIGAVKGFFARLNQLSPVALLSIRTYGGVEKYVLSCLSVELVIVIAVSLINGLRSPLSLVVLIIASLRIADILQAIINAVLLGKQVASPMRTLILAALNFIELGLCFGLYYALNYDKLSGAGRAVTGFYFSFITQLTIGYGDVYPTGWLRIVAVLQGLIAALFVILVLGRVIASLGMLNGARKS
jgi:hypothetical protein